MKKLYELRKRVKGFAPETENDFFDSKYFNINQMITKIQPVLEELDLMITQSIETDELGKMYVTLKFHDMEEDSVDTHEFGRMLLPVSDNPQKIGSAITYYRRYMLQSALFWGAFDDDGDTARADSGLTADEKEKIDNMVDVDELRTYYKENRGKGKEWDQYVITRSKELQSLAN